jgi:hypothetical protein
MLKVYTCLLRGLVRDLIHYCYLSVEFSKNRHMKVEVYIVIKAFDKQRIKNRNQEVFQVCELAMKSHAVNK